METNVFIFYLFIYVAHIEEHSNFLPVNLMISVYLKDIGVDGRIILNRF
jgi:hypothetical protein